MKVSTTRLHIQISITFVLQCVTVSEESQIARYVVSRGITRLDFRFRSTIDCNNIIKFQPPRYCVRILYSHWCCHETPSMKHHWWPKTAKAKFSFTMIDSYMNIKIFSIILPWHDIARYFVVVMVNLLKLPHETLMLPKLSWRQSELADVYFTHYDVDNVNPRLWRAMNFSTNNIRWISTVNKLIKSKNTQKANNVFDLRWKFTKKGHSHRPKGAVGEISL